MSSKYNKHTTNRTHVTTVNISDNVSYHSRGPTVPRGGEDPERGLALGYPSSGAKMQTSSTQIPVGPHKSVITVGSGESMKTIIPTIECTLTKWLLLDKHDRAELFRIGDKYDAEINHWIPEIRLNVVNISIKYRGTAPNPRQSTAEKDIQRLLDKYKLRTTVIKDVSAIISDAESVTPPSDTFLGRAPDGHVYIVGPNEKTIKGAIAKLKHMKHKKQTHVHVSPISMPGGDGHRANTSDRTAGFTKPSKPAMNKTLKVHENVWLYVNHVFPQEIANICKSYATIHTTRSGQHTLNLDVTTQEKRGSEMILDKLGVLFSKYEKIIRHTFVNTRNPRQNTMIDHIAGDTHDIYIKRTDNEVIIITRDDQMNQFIRWIRQKLDECKDTESPSLSVGSRCKTHHLPLISPVPLPPIASSEPKRGINRFHWKRTRIHIMKADITKMHVDAIVNASNKELQHNGGVAFAIAQAAGQKLQWDCDTRVAKCGPLGVADTFISDGCNLPARHVIHAVGPRWQSFPDKKLCTQLLNQTFRNCLEEADRSDDIFSIAIPAVSSGIYAVPISTVAGEMYAAVVGHLRENRKSSLTDIHLVDINNTFLRLLQNEFADGTVKEKHLCSIVDSDEENRETNSQSQKNDTARTFASGPCCICMSDITDPSSLPCGHTFCRPCIVHWEKQKPTCPECGAIFGEIKGDQPETGKMWEEYTCNRLPGFENKSLGTIEIYYEFPDGKQERVHPNPGQWYKGTRRRAFLPDNADGRETLNRLKRAFSNRVTFTIGRSTTNNRDGQITWNDIHHKTSPKGGVANYGYPDDTYLTRVREELAAKGIS